MTKEIHAINTRALDFVVELIEYIFEYPDDDYMTMECLCRKLVKYGLIDKEDGYYLVDKGIKVAEQTEPKPICESCSKNPCKKKKMINDIGHWVSECTEFDRKTEPQTEVKVEPTWVGVTYGRFEDKPHTERSEQ